MTTKTYPLTRSIVQELELGDLAASSRPRRTVGTLYIPPATQRPVVDTELMELMLTAGSGPTPVMTAPDAIPA